MNAVPSVRGQNLIYEYGQWQIDLGRRELLSDGVAVPIGARAFEIIELLVQSANELVTKNDILNGVWPGAPVGENTLHVHVSAIRKALGPDRTVLKTVSGRGYRLLGNWTPRHRGSMSTLSTPLLMRAPEAAPANNNFPLIAGRLIGRAAAARHVRDLASAYRVVTLTGPGGIGKTSLAIEASRGLYADFDGGGWFVELASLSNPDLVPSTVASALGLKLSGEISAESVARAISTKHILLVLDNCEHVIDAAADLAEQFTRLCPYTTILATSREVLRIAGEAVYLVPPLDLPAPGQDTPDNILGHSAVELFITRTNALNTGFSPHGEELTSVAVICRHLDGIPLAIEFAAASAATLGIASVAAGLRDRFALLTRGRRTALARQRTLRATLDWSHELLPDEERQLLRHLAVFQGGFTLDAAVAILADSRLDAAMVVSGIANLVAKSLVALDSTRGVPRWYLLETIRAYALEQLTENGEASAVAPRHAAYFRDFITSFASGAGSALSNEGLALCIREIDNVRAALDWAYAPNGDTATGAILTAAYAPVWLNLALLFECRDRTERAISRLTPDTDARVRMQLLIEHGVAHVFTMGSVKKALAALQVGHEIAASLDDANAEMRALWALWVLNGLSSNFNAVRSAAEQFSRLAYRTGDLPTVLFADRLMGAALQREGRHVEAQRHFERVLERYVPPKDLGYTIWANFDPRVFARAFLARSLWLRGFVEQAIAQVLTGVEEAKAVGNMLSYCEVLYFAACPIALMAGDHCAARQALTELIDASTANNSSLHRMWACGLEATLLIKGGEFASGLTILRGVLDAMTETGWTINHPELLGVAAEGLAGMGQRAEALAMVDQALATAEASGGREFVAELFRLKGEFVLQGAVEPAHAAAETCFVTALTVAEGQGALFWQLRAAMSLARLKDIQGRRDDARQGLALVYGQFTEGFETADMLVAKRMLDSLTSRPE